MNLLQSAGPLVRVAAASCALACLLVGIPAHAKPKKPATKGSSTAPAEVDAPPPEVAPAPKSVAVAEVAVAAPIDPATRGQSLSFGVVGLGDYAVIYTHSVAGGFAVVGEAFAQYSTSENGGGTAGGGGQLGARWYTNGTQRSWFVGMMAGYDGGRTTAIAVGNSSGAVVRRTYVLPYTRWRVTANFGRRWVFGPGFALTARVGVGKGERSYSMGSDVAANGEAAAQESLYNFLPISLDAEASIGWVF